MERHWRIRLYERLRAEGCSEALALEAVGTPRSTLFRWRRALRRRGLAGLADRSRRPAHVRRPQWTRRNEAAVWDMRRRFPFMGRAKVRVMLAREGTALCEATVGRILAKGVRLGCVRPCAFRWGRAKAKRQRRFEGHAKRWRTPVGSGRLRTRCGCSPSAGRCAGAARRGCTWSTTCATRTSPFA